MQEWMKERMDKRAEQAKLEKDTVFLTSGTWTLVGVIHQEVGGRILPDLLLHPWGLAQCLAPMEDA